MKSPSLAAFCAAFVLVSCAAPGPRAIPHPLGIDPHAHGMYALDHFGPGETPAVTLYGCSGETVSWQLTNLANGQVIQRSNQYVPSGHSWTVQFGHLPPGSYFVTFALHGSQIASARFLVSG